MAEIHINYLAVGAAALAALVIGALWYSPLLFGNLWQKAHGYSPEDLEALRGTLGRAYGVSLLCYLVMAGVLAVLVSYAGAATMPQGALLGFLVWIGFLATLGLTAHMVSGKPLAAYLIDTGYQLVYAVLMGVILAAWR